jgi:hypothetical protein
MPAQDWGSEGIKIVGIPEGAAYSRSCEAVTT